MGVQGQVAAFNPAPKGKFEKPRLSGSPAKKMLVDAPGIEMVIDVLDAACIQLQKWGFVEARYEFEVYDGNGTFEVRVTGKNTDV